VTLTRASLRPTAFRARKGTTVRFTLSAPARVTLTVKGAAKLAVAGRAGANTVRFRRRGLSRGSHRLVIEVAGRTASVLPFKILR